MTFDITSQNLRFSGLNSQLLIEKCFHFFIFYCKSIFSNSALLQSVTDSKLYSIQYISYTGVKPLVILDKPGEKYEAIVNPLVRLLQFIFVLKPNNKNKLISSGHLLKKMRFLTAVFF